MKSINTTKNVNDMKEKAKKIYHNEIQDELTRIAKRVIDEIFVEEELNAHEAMAVVGYIKNIVEDKWKQYEIREMRGILIADLVKDQKDE